MTQDERRAIVEGICERIVAGKPTAAIFNDEREYVAEIPTRRTFNEWRRKDPTIEFMYQQAIRDSVSLMVLDIRELADNEALSPESRRVRIGARQWLLERLFRESFGQRMTIAGDPNAPIEHHHSATIERKLFPELASSVAPPALGKSNGSGEG